MTPVRSIVDSLKSLAKSTQDLFINGIATVQHTSCCRNQIEIMKRLLREAFTDLMRVRDRQEKVERMLVLYKTSRGTPFEETGTRLRGVVDVTGALLMLDDAGPRQHDLLNRSGIKTGVGTSFTFETGIRQNDTFVAEFVASQKEQGNLDDALISPLSLEKVLYVANVSEWLSAVAIPVGAQCRDVGMAAGYSHQGNGFSDFLSFGPPSLSQRIGSGIGLTVNKSNIAASMAQFGLRLGQADSLVFSTFGQIACHLSTKTKLSLSGIHQFSHAVKTFSLGLLSSELGNLKWRKPPEGPSAGSMGVLVESQLDESTRFAGWIETVRSNPGALRWAVGVSDAPEDEIGWGLRLGGSNGWEEFQVECFLRLNLSRKFKLQPGFVYIMDRETQIPALMFRSTWSL